MARTRKRPRIMAMQLSSRPIKRLVPRSDETSSSSRVINDNDRKCLIGHRDVRHCGLYVDNPCLVDTNSNGFHCTRTWYDAELDFIPVNNVPNVDLTRTRRGILRL